MLNYSLKDFHLGNSDGKKEAKYTQDFEQYFYDYDNLYEKAMTRERYLILGRKGTGKTLLAEVIKKNKSNSNCFCEICSYKDFKFHELLILKSEDISPNEYICIWEWVILIQLGKMCCQDEGIKEKELKSKLKKFLFSNFSGLDLNSNKIIEVTKNHSLTGTLWNVGGKAEKATKSTKGSYLNYVENLRETIITLLKSSGSQYLLMYDELDDRFRDDRAYKDSLISLIKAVDNLNLKLFDSGLDSKVVLLLRSDIYSILNDPDLNKIKVDNAVVIDWGRTARKDSPLFDLIFTKIKRSAPVLKDYTRDGLFDLLFPQSIFDIPPEQHILERTFFRPRDVIIFLNMIIEKHPTTKFFGAKGFIEVQAAYSKYFFQEVRNELSGHLSDDEIDESTLLLKQFNRYHFLFRDIYEYFKKNKTSYSSIELEKVLTVLFKFSVIGNRWHPLRQPDKFHYAWAFRDDKAVVDFDKEFVVHLGLRKELSL